MEFVKLSASQSSLRGAFFICWFDFNGNCNMKRTFLFVLCLFFANNIFAATSSQSKSLSTEVQTLQQDIKNIREQMLGRDDFGFVTLSPYSEIKPIYSQYNLIVKLFDANADLQLLKQQQEIASYRIAHNIKASTHPVVALSSSLEAQGISQRDYTGGGKSDVNLSHAELDAVSELVSWARAAIFAIYDDTSPTTGARATNSQLRVDAGFITFGNLDKTPWYATLGQIYVPFGQYYNYMVTDPWTKILARTKERAAVLGYSKNDWDAAVYGFKGDTYTGDRDNVVNNWGANLYYHTVWREVRLSLGMGYIYNLADSIGMMSNGDTTTGHFTGFKSSKHLDHAVPAIGLRSLSGYGDYNFVVEAGWQNIP